MWFKVHRNVNDIRKQIIAFHNETYNQTDKMKLIILQFHIFYTYFTIKKILEVNKKQNKNLNQIRIIYNLTQSTRPVHDPRMKMILF
jgi:hypothetical protein